MNSRKPSVLVTGAGGFIGRHLVAELLEAGAEVLALVHRRRDVEGLSRFGGRIEVLEGDLLDARGLEVLLRRHRPSAIAHLAGFSSAGRSFREPERCFEVNALGTETLLAAIHRSGTKPRVLVVSSGEIYGGGEGPIAESAPPRPRSPYAASKAAAEMAALAAFHGWGIACVIARSFNHLGRGQDERFVAPSLARRIAEAEAQGGRCRLEVGNLGAVRDFSRVEDAARCYRLLLERGEPGEAYNVGCGVGFPVRAILEAMLEASALEIEVVEEPTRFRPNEAPELVASTDKLRAAIGFTPRPALPHAALEVLEQARARIAHAT